MLPDKTNIHFRAELLKSLVLSCILGSLFYTTSVYADLGVPTLDQAIQRLSDNIPQLMRLVTAFAYVMGFYLIVVGIMEMKHFGEGRTMMSREHGLTKPLLYLFVGAALIYLPSTIRTGLYTLWSAPSPLGYVPEQGSAWSQLISNSFLILQLIGVIAFIRGLLILSHLGGHGGQPGTFARGMTHIIGGILCINMYDTVRMILATLGLDTFLS